MRRLADVVLRRSMAVLVSSQGWDVEERLSSDRSSPHRVVPEALDDAVSFTRESFGEVVAEPGTGLIVLLALDVQCRCGHAYPGVFIHLVSGYEFPVVGFKHYSVSGEQMCCVRVFRYSGHGCEANQHGGVDCLLGNSWLDWRRVGRNTVGSCRR